MYIVLFIILALVGLFMTLSPGTVYEITEMWKNRDKGEPSDSYIFWMRVRGIIVMLVSIGGIIGSAWAYYHGEL